MKDFNAFLQAKPVVINDRDIVRQSLRNLITTEKGTRVFNRAYGLGLEKYIGRTATFNLARELEFDLRVNVERSENRISVDNSSVKVVTLNDNDLRVSFSYQIKKTEEWDSFTGVLSLIQSQE